jgi:hypothetical protein
MHARQCRTMIVFLPLAALTISCLPGTIAPGRQAGAAQVQSTMFDAERTGRYFSSLAPCDERMTHGIGGYWTPPQTLKGLLDERVTHALSDALAQHSSGYRAADYHVQYLGIVREGRRIVLVNGIHGDHSMQDWREHPAILCDAGIAAFQAEYDLAAGAMSAVRFSTRFAP